MSIKVTTIANLSLVVILIQHGAPHTVRGFYVNAHHTHTSRPWSDVNCDPAFYASLCFELPQYVVELAAKS